MADLVTNRGNEIIVNGTRIPIVGGLRRFPTSDFADKQVIGAYGVDSMKRTDVWQVPLYPAYCGVEESVGNLDRISGRSWFANLFTDNDGYTALPRLATAISTFNIYDVTPTWTISTASSGDTGWVGATYTFNGAGEGWSTFYTSTFSGFKAGRFKITIAKGDPNSTVTTLQIDISDGVTWTNIYNATPSPWSGEKILDFTDQFVYQVRMRVYETAAEVDQVTFSGIGLETADGATVSGTLGVSANFNGNLYWAKGNQLVKLAADRLSFTSIFEFPANITDLIPSLNSRLYIFLGDSYNYCWMSTAEAITVSNSAAAKWGIQFDGKLWKLSSTGAFAYSTNPDNASPTWTSGGAITDIASEIENLLLGYDSNGNTQMYCATHSQLKIYDDTNAIWVGTEVKLPNHPNGGKGACYWNGGHYFSYGTGVKEYRPIDYSVKDIGLNMDDGLPLEYNGEIVKLYGDNGVPVMFAAIDGTQASGTNTSSLWAYDGTGWKCWWTAPATGTAVSEIIVSSASSAYSVYWINSTAAYYIDLKRGTNSPRQVAYNYATAGFLVSPDFDAGFTVGRKNAIRTRCSVRGDVSATETVTVGYRIDHATTALATTWTTLGSAIVASGETTFLMPTSAAPAGVLFRTIQFRIDLARGSTTTKTPVVVYLALDYYKCIPKSWGWSATLNLSQKYGDKSPDQLVAALITASEVENLITLVYEDTTKYVRIEDIQLSYQTGTNTVGSATIKMSEV